MGKELRGGNSFHVAKTIEIVQKQNRLKRLRNPQTWSANPFTTVASQYKL